MAVAEYVFSSRESPALTWSEFLFLFWKKAYLHVFVLEEDIPSRVFVLEEAFFLFLFQKNTYLLVFVPEEHIPVAHMCLARFDHLVCIASCCSYHYACSNQSYFVSIYVFKIEKVLTKFEFKAAQALEKMMKVFFKLSNCFCTIFQDPQAV